MPKLSILFGYPLHHITYPLLENHWSNTMTFIWHVFLMHLYASVQILFGATVVNVFFFFSFLTYTVYPLQEAGFTGFMRNLRGRDQEKVGKRKEEL